MFAKRKLRSSFDNLGSPGLSASFNRFLLFWLLDERVVRKEFNYHLLVSSSLFWNKSKVSFSGIGNKKRRCLKWLIKIWQYFLYCFLMVWATFGWVFFLVSIPYCRLCNCLEQLLQQADISSVLFDLSLVSKRDKIFEINIIGNILEVKWWNSKCFVLWHQLRTLWSITGKQKG